MAGVLAVVAASGPGVRISLASVPNPCADVTFGGTSNSSIRLENDGDIVTIGTTAGTVDVGDWVTPKSAAGATYEARLTVNSGSITGSATGSWLALSTTRTWTTQRIATGVATANVTLEIRHASGTVLASATFNITAENTA